MTTAWLFGAIWLAAISGAPLTVMARRLGASDFRIGLLAAAPFLASLLTLPAGVWVDRTGRHKQAFLFGLFGQRLLCVPMALVPAWLLWSGRPAAAVAVLIGLVFSMHAAGAVGGPGWIGWMSDLVPGRSRATFFARRRRWGIVTSLPAAIGIGWLLDGYRASSGLVVVGVCSIVLLVAAVFGVADIALLTPVRHTPAPPNRGPVLATLAGPLRDKPFLWASSFVAVLVFAAAMTGQFTTIYLIEKLGVSNLALQLMLLAVPMAAQFVFAAAWGRWVDRYGRRPVLLLAAAGLVPVGLGWALVGGAGAWLGYTLAAAGAVLWTGVEVANLDLQLAFARAGAGYASVNAVLVNIAGCAGGLFAGTIAAALHGKIWTLPIAWLPGVGAYEIIFASAALLRLGAVLWIGPKLRSAGDAGVRATVVSLTIARWAREDSDELIALPVAEPEPLRRAA